MAGSDVILLEGLRIMALCGALPEERGRPQPFEFTVEVETDLAAAGASDDLDQTIHYGLLTDDIVALIGGTQYTLIERMAQVVADAALAYDMATAVTVTVRKLRPPVPHDLATSGVRITRRKS